MAHADIIRALTQREQPRTGVAASSGGQSAQKVADDGRQDVAWIETEMSGDAEAGYGVARPASPGPGLPKADAQLDSTELLSRKGATGGRSMTAWKLVLLAGLAFEVAALVIR